MCVPLALLPLNGAMYALVAVELSSRFQGACWAVGSHLSDAGSGRLLGALARRPNP